MVGTLERRAPASSARNIGRDPTRGGDTPPQDLLYICFTYWRQRMASVTEGLRTLAITSRRDSTITLPPTRALCV